MKGSDSPVIIRKNSVSRRKKTISQWKNILADFFMISLALFLLLWMSSSSSLEQKAAVSSYFQNPGDLDVVKARAETARLVEERQKEDQTHPDIPDEILEAVEKASRLQSERDLYYLSLEEKINQQVKTLPQGYANALEMSKTRNGLRLEILEQEGQPMFHRGSDKLMPVYQKMIVSLAPNLAATGQSLTILGHTDATSFAVGSGRDNWYLSTARAQAARRVLVQGGFPADRIVQVAGMADRQLRDTDNPNGASNRRVEILIDMNRA